MLVHVAKTDLESQIPESWTEASKRYADLEKTENQARRNYRRNVDEAYKTVMDLRAVIGSADELAGLEQQLKALETAVFNDSAEAAMDQIKASEAALGAVAGTSTIKARFSKARRALKGKDPEPEKAATFVNEGLSLYTAEVEWRRRAADALGAAIVAYDAAIKDSIGLRLQRRLNPDQVKAVASCQSIHRDFSLQF